MNKKRLKIFALGLALTAVFGFSGLTISAQETQEANEAIENEQISAQDLGVSTPNVLPGDPLYFLKDWVRGVRSFFTFNPVKKFELRARFADERLIEMKKMIEEKRNPEAIEKASRNYEKETEEMNNQANKLKEKAGKNPELNRFLDKWTQHQILHQKLLEKLESQVPLQALEKIKKARERHLERFKNVMMKLEEKEEFPKRLERAVKNLKGGPFKEIKALEILKELEKRTPGEGKRGIQNAQERILSNLQKKLEKMPEKKREMIKDYVEKLPGDPDLHMKVLQDVTAVPQLKKLRGKIVERISKKIEKKAEEKGCPKWSPPAPDFCKNGRIVIKRDSKGCPLPPRCIPYSDKELLRIKCISECLKSHLPYAPENLESCLKKGISSEKPVEYGLKCVRPYMEKRGIKDKEKIKDFETCLKKCLGIEESQSPACYTLWDPVCGKDGTTYTNACWAKVAGTEIAYKGPCKSECAQAEEKVNRNPLLGPIDKKCCPGLVEERVSKSYSICRKPKPNEIKPKEKQELKPECREGEIKEYKTKTGMPSKCICDKGRWVCTVNSKER